MASPGTCGCCAGVPDCPTIADVDYLITGYAPGFFDTSGTTADEARPATGIYDVTNKEARFRAWNGRGISNYTVASSGGKSCRFIALGLRSVNNRYYRSGPYSSGLELLGYFPPMLDATTAFFKLAIILGTGGELVGDASNITLTLTTIFAHRDHYWEEGTPETFLQPFERMITDDLLLKERQNAEFFWSQHIIWTGAKSDGIITIAGDYTRTGGSGTYPTGLTIEAETP